MNTKIKLGERAVLMRLQIGLCGESRQDVELTSEVKSEKGLGQAAGKWVKNLWPAEALKEIKKLDNESRAFHLAITLPFDNGIGILPAGLIMEYRDRMFEYARRREALVNEFLKDPIRWVEWAVSSHNGTFDPSLYPGCFRLAPDKWGVEEKVWRESMLPHFTFSTVPLPVPDGGQFAATVASLLGTDTASVDQRVADAAEEARKELLRRIIEPVTAMATKLQEAPKNGREDIVFRDTLVSNLKDIARIGPAMNLTDDPQIATFLKEIESLTKYDAQTLRDNKLARFNTAKAATDLCQKLSGYKL